MSGPMTVAKASCEFMPKTATADEHTLILGAGPVGMAAAFELSKAKRQYLNGLDDAQNADLYPKRFMKCVLVFRPRDIFRWRLSCRSELLWVV